MRGAGADGVGGGAEGDGENFVAVAEGGVGAPPNENVPPAPRPARHQKRAPGFIPPQWLKWAVFALSLLPFLYVAGAIASDFFEGTRYLGSNPIKEAEHFTGKWALRFLALSLAITPAVRILRQGWLIRYRRTFGLFAFFYACVHLTVYGALDVAFDWSDMIEDVAKRLYITIGMTALALMIPLAVTSTKGWIRRMGNKRWNALHRLVYVSAVLGLVHYWMSVKKDITEPALFGLVFAILLGWRAWRAWGSPSRTQGSPAR